MAVRLAAVLSLGLGFLGLVHGVPELVSHRQLQSNSATNGDCGRLSIRPDGHGVPGSVDLQGLSNRAPKDLYERDVQAVRVHLGPEVQDEVSARVRQVESRVQTRTRDVARVRQEVHEGQVLLDRLKDEDNVRQVHRAISSEDVAQHNALALVVIDLVAVGVPRRDA